MQNLQEFIELVNNKEWDELINNDYAYWLKFTFKIEDLTQVFPKDFFHNFIFNEKSFTLFTHDTKSLGQALPYVLSQLAVKSNFNESDWEKWCQTFEQYKNKNIIDFESFQAFFKPIVKNDAYFEYILQDDNFSYYLKETKLSAQSILSFNYHYTQSVDHSTFTNEAKQKLKDIIMANQLAVSSQNIANIFGDDIDDISKYIDTLDQPYWEIGIAYQNVDYHTFENIFINNGLSDQLEFNMYMTWFEKTENNIGEPLLNKIFNQIKNNKIRCTYDLMKTMTNAQIKDNIDNIDLTNALYSDLLLSDIVNMKKIGTDLNNISESMRFFTDEEIAKYPNLFNPAKLIKEGGIYISESTLSLLNKTWHKRQRYTLDNMTFEQILRDNVRSNRPLTFENLNYLISKTSPNIADVNAIILQLNSSSIFQFKEELNTFIGFVNKYK